MPPRLLSIPRSGVISRLDGHQKYLRTLAGTTKLQKTSNISQRFSSLDTQARSSNLNNNENESDTGKAQQYSANQSSLEAIRTSILKSALEEVHHYGWSEDALAAATTKESENNYKHMSMSVMGMVTVDDLIRFCMDQWNEELKKDLQKQKAAMNDETHAEDLLERGLKTRLQYLTPYLESNRWHEGMALGIRGPSNALQTQQQLKEMIDIIVEAADYGDRLSAPERMALGAVYVATELHLLTDKSPDYRDTWAFLSSRMDDWRRLISFASTADFSFSPSQSNRDGKSGIGDSFFVATSVASSLVGGLVSLVMNPTQGIPTSFGLPKGVYEALFRNQQANWQQENWQFSSNRPTDEQDGSHPSHYDRAKSSPARKL